MLLDQLGDPQQAARCTDGTRRELQRARDNMGWLLTQRQSYEYER